MNALEFLRWYNKTIWNRPGDKPPPNMTVEPCHCSKKHWGVACKGWTLKPKSVEQLRKERGYWPSMTGEIKVTDIDRQVHDAIKNKKQVQEELTSIAKDRSQVRKHK